MSESPAISVIITACNEADLIGDCLRSVLPFAAEIVVIDLESTDALTETVAAVAPQARIVPHSRVDVVEKMRQFSLGQASHEWALILDPDERASEGLGAKLAEIASGPGIGAVRIPRRNIIFGKRIEHSGWRGDSQLRFVRRDGVEWPPTVHSVPKIAGEIVDLPSDGPDFLHHLNYTSVAQFVEKMNRYTTNEANKMSADGRRFTLVRLFYNMGKQFWDRYVTLKGYKDGRHGLVLSVLMGFYAGLSYIKLWESELPSGEATGKP